MLFRGAMQISQPGCMIPRWPCPEQEAQVRDGDRQSELFPSGQRTALSRLEVACIIRPVFAQLSFNVVRCPIAHSLEALFEYAEVQHRVLRNHRTRRSR